MASGIKIINILKGDKFEEVFDEFKKAQAEEVILIFPQNSHIAKDESHFVTLASVAQDSGKTITVMTADDTVRNYSQKFGFKFLASPGKSLADDKVVVKEGALEESAEDDVVDEVESDEPEKKEEEPEDNITDKIFDEEMTKSEKEVSNDEEEIEEETEKEEEEYEDDGAVAETAMAKARKITASGADLSKKGHTLGKLKGISPDKERASAKKLENLESIWFKGEKRDSSRSDMWSSKLFRHSKRSTKTNFYILSGTVVALGLIFYFFLGNAQVILKPQKQQFNFELALTTSSNAAKINPETKTIPGQLLSYKEEVSKDFAATGQKEVAQKARGEISVYNNYSSEPQIFVATTRFESPNGLIFRIPRPVTIPGTRTVGGKSVPGSTKIEVLADKPGAEYNIGLARFTVPGLKGSPKFEGFYAESTTAFGGGAAGLSKVVTETDFNNAKEEVTKEALGKASTTLKSKANNLKVIEPVENKIISLQSTAEAEQASDGFSVKATAEAKTIGFAEDMILELIRLHLSKDQEMVLLKDSLRIDYKNAKPNFENNSMTFTIVVQGEAAAKINEQKIVNDLLGMKQGNIRDYLFSIKEIESAKVILSPFWVRVVPKDPDDVKVRILY